MFLFEVDGVQIGVFQEVSGLELQVAVKEYEEGGENGFVHKFPGRSSWPHIVMKSGVTNSDALFQWVSKSSGDGFAAAGNKITRCTGAITAIGTDGTQASFLGRPGCFPGALERAPFQCGFLRGPSGRARDSPSRVRLQHVQRHVALRRNVMVDLHPNDTARVPVG